MKTIFKWMLGILIVVCLFGACNRPVNYMLAYADTTDASTNSELKEFEQYEEGVE